MQITLYSPDPNFTPIIIEVDPKYWHSTQQYIDIENKKELCRMIWSYVNEMIQSKWDQAEEILKGNPILETPQTGHIIKQYCVWIKTINASLRGYIFDKS